MERTGTGGVEEAFAHIEQAKSRTLFDLMFQPVHALAREEGSESQLAHSIRELREELNWYYHLVELEQLRPGDQTSRAARRVSARDRLAREGDGARAARAEADRLVAVRSPRAVGVLARRDPRGTARRTPRSSSIFQVDDRIVLCLLDAIALEMAPVSVMPRVAEHVRMLQFQFSKFRLGADYV